MTRAFFILCFCCSLQAAELFNQYMDHKELETELSSLKHRFLNKQILCKTAEGNPVHILTLSDSEDPKPAILIIGDTVSNSPVGSEIIVQWLKRLIKNDETLTEILKKNTLYIIPRPAPDALKNIFGPAVNKLSSNSRSIDDDKDQKYNEDPFEDLNKDGFITLMRVTDSDGQFDEHPEMPLIMAKAKPGKGKYSIHSEGIDNDKDEQFNEDPDGGVDFNRNFSFKYPYFSRGAGSHQISEPETRAIADFAFSRPEIFLVISFGQEDNLINPWKEDGKKKGIHNKETIFKDDEMWLQKYADIYKKVYKPVGNPGKVERKGDFAQWAYFHLGKMSVTINPWWIPFDAKSKLKDNRNADEVKKALWLKKNRPEALAAWQETAHPDFPNNKVEIGGIKPGYDFIPDIKTAHERSMKFGQFIDKALQLQSEVSAKKISLSKLGNSVYRLEFTLFNRTDLPTSSKIGQHVRKNHPLNITLSLPDNWEIYKGYNRRQTNHLNPGESRKLEWLLIQKGNEKPIVKVKVESPQLQELNFKAEEKK